MEADKETGNSIIEYVYGGYEWVEPSIIKESLLPKEQGDTGGDFHWL